MQSLLQPINISSLKVGEPVPWNIYDAKGSLLLRKGFMIVSENQLSVFSHREMYIEKKLDDEANRRLILANVSVVRLLDEASHDLRDLFKDIERATLPELTYDNTLHIAKALEHAIAVNTDICLAHIFFNKFGNENYPLRHSIDSAILAILIAQSLEKTEHETGIIAAAALTMNVGMLILQEQLLRRNDKLTTSEKTKINQHPENSVTLLRKAGIVDEEWLSYVLMHHEKIDGSGYPQHLAGSDIPEGAQILSLADRYSACLSPRRYRPGMLATEVMRDLFINQASTIDVVMAGLLVKILGVYPPGIFVRLQNGEVAVVVKRGKIGTTPLVISFIAPRGGPMSFPIKRDTREKSFAIRGGVRLSREDVPYTMHQLWGKQAE